MKKKNITSSISSKEIEIGTETGIETETTDIVHISDTENLKWTEQPIGTEREREREQKKKRDEAGE